MSCLAGDNMYVVYWRGTLQQVQVGAWGRTKRYYKLNRHEENPAS